MSDDKNAGEVGAGADSDQKSRDFWAEFTAMTVEEASKRGYLPQQEVFMKANAKLSDGSPRFIKRPDGLWFDLYGMPTPCAMMTEDDLWATGNASHTFPVLKPEKILLSPEFMASSQPLRELFAIKTDVSHRYLGLPSLHEATPDDVTLNSAVHPGSEPRNLTKDDAPDGEGSSLWAEHAIRDIIFAAGDEKYIQIPLQVVKAAGGRDGAQALISKVVKTRRPTVDHAFTPGSVETAEMEVAGLVPPPEHEGARWHWVQCRDEPPVVWQWLGTEAQRPSRRGWQGLSLYGHSYSWDVGETPLGYRYLGPAEYRGPSTTDQRSAGVWRAHIVADLRKDHPHSRLILAAADRIEELEQAIVSNSDLLTLRDEALAIVDKLEGQNAAMHVTFGVMSDRLTDRDTLIDSLTTERNALRDALAKTTDPDVKPSEPPINHALRVKVADPRRMGIGGTG